ncbi:MAG: hypothetical protein IT245_01730 [Bacteroidia bacterium]|nr:hypothetical protein [Bacteroidia bacterium]
MRLLFLRVLNFSVIIVLLLGCKVNFIPEYSSVLEEKIISGAKMHEKLYLDMAVSNDTNSRNYNNWLSRYNEIEIEINSIKFMNETREKNEDMLKIVGNLASTFLQYKNEHRVNRHLSDGQIILYNEYLKAKWLPLLKAEIALKSIRKR